ncbi:MAG: hypothetical protein JXB04_04940 [Kiritimatiellae bacterium]|nr:hypothetical protein [Kiritimatiellia bacterium]
MSAFWDISTVRRVQERLRADRARTEERRKLAAGIAGLPPSDRIRFRKEFLLHDPRVERRKTIAYIVVVGGIFLYLLFCILYVITQEEQAEPDQVSPADLPRPMKGYVIFAYRKSNETFFVLMHGTNRKKTFDEIDADTPTVSDTQVHLKLTGLEEGRRLRDLAELHELPIRGIRETPQVEQSTIPAFVTSASLEEIDALRRLLAEKQKP